MLVKGAAVLAHTDWRVARRPMDDLDVAVPRALAPRAIAVLRERGFESPLAGDPRHLDERHALAFRDPAGAELDLHWHVLHGSRSARTPTPPSGRRRGRRGCATSSAACCAVRTRCCRRMTQGRAYSDSHPLRWAADADRLLHGGEGFDWTRVIEQARRHRLDAAVSARHWRCWRR